MALFSIQGPFGERHYKITIQPMNTILQYSQNILGLGVLLLIIAFLILTAFWLADKVFEKYWTKGAQAQWEKDQHKLRDMAMWFSEDEPTKHLLLDIAQYSDPNHVRGKWRERRERLKVNTDPTP